MEVINIGDWWVAEDAQSEEMCFEQMYQASKVKHGRGQLHPALVLMIPQHQCPSFPKVYNGIL